MLSSSGLTAVKELLLQGFAVTAYEGMLLISRLSKTIPTDNSITSRIYSKAASRRRLDPLGKSTKRMHCFFR